MIELINILFPDLSIFETDVRNVMKRVILTPKNNSVQDINDLVLQSFLGDTIIYASMDKTLNPVIYANTEKTLNPTHQEDYADFLNKLQPSGLPPHILRIKKNCPVILLRNIDPTEGLSNGTRLICKELRKYTIYAEIAVGKHLEKRVFLHPITLESSYGDTQGITFKRIQFPIRLCLSMTINKAQGQTLDFVGIILENQCFVMANFMLLYQELDIQQISSS